MEKDSGTETTAARLIPARSAASATAMVASVLPNSTASTIGHGSSQKRPAPLLEAQEGPDQQSMIDPRRHVLLDHLGDVAWINELGRHEVPAQQHLAHIVGI